MSHPIPADRATTRYRLPVEAPTRDLLIASLASIAGACQLAAWALAHLPTFFVVLGVTLIAIAFGFALHALVRHYRFRWIAYVGAESLTIVNGQRRTVLPWSKVSGVHYGEFRIQITGEDGTGLNTLPVDRTRPAHEAAQAVERAIAGHLPART